MFDVRVVASENFQNYTAYTLKVTSGGSTWQLSKRYSDFEAFNSKLRDRFPMLALPKLPGKVWFGSMSQGVVEHRKQALQDYMLELTDRSDVCTCADTLRFLNADEHNTAIKHAIQEDLRQAHVTNLHTEETRAKVQAREQENLSLQAEIDCLLREAAAVHARCESCDTEINTLRPMIVEQAESIETKSREAVDLSKKKQACLEQVANLQQSNELSLQAVKKATDALAASQCTYDLICASIRDAEFQRNALEDALLDRRVQLQALQKDVGEVEAECRRDEDALRDLQLRDAAAAGGSVQAEAQLLLSSRRVRPLNQLGANA